MGGFITTAVVGVVLIVIGVINLSGNISTLHSYHRHRVAEEDKKPMGKRVGIGMLITGASCLLWSAALFVHEQTAIAWLLWGGTAVLALGMAAGLAIMLWAIVKYNKGLF